MTESVVNPQPSQIRLRSLLLVTLYVISLAYGVGQVFAPSSGALYYLAAFAMASAAAWWVTSDAHDRGKPLLHIVQIVIFLTWPITVPIYLIATRKLRGLGWSMVHGLGLTIALMVGFYVTVFCLYGAEGFVATQ